MTSEFRLEIHQRFAATLCQLSTNDEEENGSKAFIEALDASSAAMMVADYLGDRPAQAAVLSNLGSLYRFWAYPLAGHHRQRRAGGRRSTLA